MESKIMQQDLHEQKQILFAINCPSRYLQPQQLVQIQPIPVDSTWPYKPIIAVLLSCAKTTHVILNEST